MTGSFGLEGRVALITGASRGLGRMIAIGLANAGATVVLAARDADKLRNVAREIADTGGNADVQPLDLADLDAVAGAVPNLLERHERLDILINNGAISTWSSLEESTMADWHRVFDVNLSATYLLCREAARPMRRQGWGRIVNFASYVATTGRERLAAYSASKSAVSGLTRSIAAELASDGITCNAISPGIFDTDMAAPAIGHPQRARIFRQAIAMQRFGDPSEIVGPVLFLASEASSYVTGHVLNVDGGIANILSLPVTVEE